jgi:uncharacterized membrane protein
MSRLPALWISLRSSLWFVPSVVVLCSMAGAETLSQVSAHVPALSQDNLPVIFAFGADGSRAMLSAIATSTITIAGVAFSITIVVLSLTSSQYSPRVLRQFMRDRANQWVLGVFVGVFAYCLVLLPNVRGGDEHGFVPAIAVAGGVLYALAAVGCLIFFIHHVASSIQVSSIVASIAAETRLATDHVFPAVAETSPPWPDAPAERWHVIPSPASGYIQLVAQDALVHLAAEHRCLVRLERAVGEFTVAGTPLLSTWPRPDDPAALARVLTSTVSINCAQTVEQDVSFGVRQIVDIALRALSPALSDPTTAVLCIEYLTTILHPLAPRTMGPRVLTSDGGPRVLLPRPTFLALLAATFGEIRAHTGTEFTVYAALLRGLAIIAEATSDNTRRAALATETTDLRYAVAHGFPAARAQPLLAAADTLSATLRTA